jgi:predicted AAA+ superfamily ATPase
MAEFLAFRGLEANGQSRNLRVPHLKEYMRAGGFPEAALEPEDAARSRMLVELFDDMVLKDAARTRKLRDLNALRQVAAFMAGAVGSPTSVHKMHRTFRLSMETLSAYIDALRSAYLIFPCHYHSRSANERTYNPKKYYMIDTGMASAVLGSMNEGAAVENLLALHFMRTGEVRYWRSEGELDLVLNDGRTAVESKFKDRIGPRDIKGGLRFAMENGLDRLHVATAEHEGVETIEGVEVHFTPAVKILLGEAEVE